MVNAKRKAVRFLCFVFGIAMCFVYGAAFAAGGSIEVKKTWEHGSNPMENRPDSVEVSLLRGSEVQDTVTLSGENGWSAVFSDVPKYDDDGRVITYTLSERRAEGYTSAIVQQPSAGGLNISSVSQKVTPANKDTYEIGGATFVIAKTSHSSQREYSYCVWTEAALGEDEREEFIELVNKGGLQGFGKDLTARNTMFRNGSGAVFTLGSESVTVGGLSGNHAVTFSNTKAWALFYYGALNRIAAKSGVISNTYVQESTPSPEVTPDASSAPEATKSPQVTSTPEETKTPEVTESPESTATPEVTNTPAVTSSPAVTATPDVTQTPTAATSPEVNETPSATQAPEPTVSPGITAKPTARPTVSPTASPVIGDVDETPKSGDPSVVLWAVAVVILSAGAYYFMSNKKHE